MKRTISRTLPTPGVPVGFVNGKPVFPILGASDDDPSNDDATVDDDERDTSDDEQDTDSGDDTLGDAGKQALDRMKTERREERQARRAAERERDALKQQLDALNKKDDDAPDADAIRAEIEAEVTRKAHERILRSEIKAAATGKMADPTDAALYLNLSDFEVGEDGTIDEAEIADAITDLITQKPHLAAAQGGSKGSGDGGARKGHKASQLSQGDLDRMSSEEIVRAQAEGRLNDLLGIKSP